MLKIYIPVLFQSTGFFCARSDAISNDATSTNCADIWWHLGGLQSDVANLNAEDIDWENHAIAYAKKKTGTLAIIHFGDEIAYILRRLPESGSLFPHLRRVRSGDRATEFRQRCDGLGIAGVSLHSYRYAWAERARKCG